MSHICIALLRGINVGGKNKLPMKDLAALFVEAGCTDVRTYIQSGNVVFAAEEDVAAHISEDVATAIADRFGYDVPVVIRSATEWHAAIARNPFADADVPNNRLQVAFLAATPSEEQLSALDPDRSPPDEFVVAGRDIYIHCPNGFGRSKLTNTYFDAKLKTVSTMRNWNTVVKLAELASD